MPVITPPYRLLSAALRARNSTSFISFQNHPRISIAFVSVTPPRAYCAGAQRQFSIFRRAESQQTPVPKNDNGTSKFSKPLLTTTLTPKKEKRENIYNVPNFLTATRLFTAPVIGYLIVTSQPVYALSLFTISAITDFADGVIARHWNLHTVVGSVIDPMADKVLMTILTVTLAMQGTLPVWLAVIILGRDVGLAISALWWRWISLPPPKTMKRYWDFGLPSAQVLPTNISKLNTVLQMALLGACMVDPVIAGGAEWAANLEALKYTVAGTTVWSGLSYLYTKGSVKIIKHETPLEKAVKELEAAEKAAEKAIEGGDEKMKM